ncbi:MAG: L,D-transpeptidase family protein [Vicinamibacteria bacterium]|nr:L,D-transpeptidase family protein [Vicinamibacteria bacterium]
MLLLLGIALSAAAALEPCDGKGTAVLVRTADRVLSLCEANRTKETMRVALGTGGVDKKREGDAKVPLGEYTLARARASKDYHLFLHVGYPTVKQRRAGLTGSAVGVHGPPRGFNHPSSTNTDWTLGCIAVGTDAEIERLAAWTNERKVRRIIIE